MHDLVAYGGGLFGVGVLLYQAWSGASLEHVLSSAAMSGLVAYLTLAVGFAMGRYVVTAAPDPASSNGESAATSAETEPESEALEDDTAPTGPDEQPVAEPQAA
jgi:hypothetical protein